MSKKLKIPKSKLKALEGFEDIIDLIEEEEAETYKKIGSITNDKLADNYGLYNYLDNEHQRLKKLKNLFSVKLENIVKNDQTRYLIKAQESKKGMLKQELIQKIMKSNSVFMRKLEGIWNSTY